MATTLRTNKLSSGNTDTTLEKRVMLMGASGSNQIANLATNRSTSSDIDRILRQNDNTISFKPGNYDTPERVGLLTRALGKANQVTFLAGDEGDAFRFDETVNTTLNDNDIEIDATGAKFISRGVDGDLFRFSVGNTADYKRLDEDGVSDSEKEALRTDFKWTGGEIDISNSLAPVDRKTERLSPRLRAAGAPTSTTGESTADGLALIGRVRGQSDTHGLGNVEIDGLKVVGGGVRGSNGWTKAGGDSGLFITDANNITVKNSEFDGLRDAGIYITDFDGLGTESATITNNLVQNSNNGIATKRGQDNVKINDNYVLNNNIGISFDRAAGNSGANATGRVFNNNEVKGNNVVSADSFTSFRLRDARDGDFSGNTIFANNANNVGNFDNVEEKTSTGTRDLDNNEAAFRDSNTTNIVNNTTIDQDSDATVANLRSEFEGSLPA